MMSCVNSWLLNENKIIWESYINHKALETFIIDMLNSGGARGVMVIVAGYGHGDPSSNLGPDWLHFT